MSRNYNKELEKIATNVAEFAIRTPPAPARRALNPRAAEFMPARAATRRASPARAATRRAARGPGAPFNARTANGFTLVTRKKKGTTHRRKERRADRH